MCYWRNLRKASSNFGRLSGIKQVPKLQTKEKTHIFSSTRRVVVTPNVKIQRLEKRNRRKTHARI